MKRRPALSQLDQLHAGIRRCTGCRLHRTRTHAVPGEGSPGARIMFIGEAPGASEDLSGTPFVGRSGKFLDEMFAAHALDRRRMYITSAVKCRPPGNRVPADDELETCRGLWLDRQIALIDPAIIVLLGKTPLRQLFRERKANLADIHGQVRMLQGRPCLLTYHPAAAMRFPVARSAMQQDLRKLMQLIRDNPRTRD